MFPHRIAAIRQMSAFVTYAAIMAGCTAIGWGAARLFGKGKKPADPIRKHPPGMEEPDPYRLCGAVLTPPEKAFYHALLGIVPVGGAVFAKVRLADLLHVSYGAGDRADARARIGNKSLDFVVCDGSLLPRVAICLDEGTDDRERLRAREFVTRVCEKAGLRIERFPLQPEYPAGEISERIARHLNGAS